MSERIIKIKLSFYSFVVTFFSLLVFQEEGTIPIHRKKADVIEQNVLIIFVESFRLFHTTCFFVEEFFLQNLECNQTNQTNKCCENKIKVLFDGGFCGTKILAACIHWIFLVTYFRFSHLIQNTMNLIVAHFMV